MDICPECDSGMESNLEHYEGSSMTVFFECKTCGLGFTHEFDWVGTIVQAKVGNKYLPEEGDF